jgi:hypothetical protein
MVAEGHQEGSPIDICDVNGNTFMLDFHTLLWFLSGKTDASMARNRMSLVNIATIDYITLLAIMYNCIMHSFWS